MKIQEQLRNGVSLDDLVEDLSLIVRKHADGRTLLKYSMISSPMGNEIVQECRGLILDANDNWNVVSMAFTKFFNYGEGHAADIDWSTASVMEKVDGSLITLYYHNDQWNIQTTGTIDAMCDVGIYNTTFSQLFKDAFNHSLDVLDENYFYAFELATLYNRVVTRYEEDQIVLLSIRDKNTLEELPFNHAEYRRITDSVDVVRLPNCFSLASLDDCLKAAEALPLLQEGYVVVDAAFNRIKIKSASYVDLHHLKDSENTIVDKMWNIAKVNEGDEFLVYFPEYIEIYDRIKVVYDDQMASLNALWNSVKHIEDRKEFALAILGKHPFHGTLFRVKFGDLTVAESFNAIDTKKVAETLNLKQHYYLTKEKK